MIRYITQFLFGLILLQGWGFIMGTSAVYAQAPIQLETTSIGMTSTEVLPHEVIERRTATSKHYQLGPQLYEARISAELLHYRDKQGQWQDIDLRPRRQRDGSFQVAASEVKISFPAKLETRHGLEIQATVYLPTRDTISDYNTLPLIDGKPDLSQIAARGLLAKRVQTEQTMSLALQWQPQPLQWVTAAAITTVATATSEEVIYDSGAIRQHFYPRAEGLRQVLELVTISNEFTATHLIQLIRLNLPPTLYREGLTFYNQSGQAVLTLMAPQLTDQAGQTWPLAYQLEPTETGVDLTVTIPLTLAQAYPLQIESGFRVPRTLFSNTLHGFQQAGQMWECQPKSGLFADDVMRVGNRSDGQCVAGIERALVQWDMSALPITAVIAFQPESAIPNAALKGKVQSELWHLPASDGGGGTISVTTHRLLEPWAAEATTWQTRTMTQSWTAPGGGNQDYLATAETMADIFTQGSPQYVNLGSLHSLVGGWHTNDVFATICKGGKNCYGDINHGVMYQAGNELSGKDLDRAFARGAVSETAPSLLVSYFDNIIMPIANSLLTIPRAPSPDSFFVRSEINSSWSAIAIQPVETTTRSDYDLVLVDGGATSPVGSANILAALASPNVKISQQRGTKTDFIVISPKASPNFLLAWAVQFDGISPYYIKYITNTPRLNLGDSKNVTISKNSVMQMYELNLTAGIKYNLRLDYVSGTADLSLVLFPPSKSQAFAIQDALDVIDAGTFGEGEKTTFIAAQTGIYGLAVLNNGQGSSSTSSFNLKLQKYVAQNYLPILLKQPPPAPPPIIVPDNGDFELGLDKWTAMNPGSPLVVTSVANPDSSCFSGKTVALLGTPTGPTELINNIPINREVILSQSFKVPANAKELTFQYKVTSYDIVQNNKGIYDYFSVRINGLEQNPPGKIGNPAQSLPQEKVLTSWNSGCQTGSINLQQYAGKSITLEFAVRNGVWNDRNTWAYLDEVKVETN